MLTEDNTQKYCFFSDTHTQVMDKLIMRERGQIVV